MEKNKITKTMINEALPSFYWLAKNYRTLGSCGDVIEYQKTLKSAKISWDEGEKPEIYLIGVGEALPPKVYYDDFDNSYNILRIIEDFIKGYNKRKQTISEIQKLVLREIECEEYEEYEENN